MQGNKHDIPDRGISDAEVSGEWQVGEVILDRYEVVAELGVGGMGKVLKVHDRHWDMDLAVKNPKANLFQTDTQKENFLRECHAWMDLGLHNHIVTCHYVRVLGGIPRVFAEYIDGGSLKDWIDNGSLYAEGTDAALERILDIAIQFAGSLHYAHEKGLIHQDVKPANVMMTAVGTVKLTDFGLANARAVIVETVAMPQGASILASYGGMTPAYCSPEQADIAARRQVGVPVDQLPKLTRRTDLYSWGVSVLEMFTGAVTWQAGNVAGHALESYLQHGPDEEDGLEIPASVADLLRQCLQQDPTARPQDMNAAVDSLRAIYENLVGKPYPREMPMPAREMADVLNNKGLSYMDLDAEKYGDRAESLWREALTLDAHHPEATYNLNVREWRTALIPVDEVVRRMEEVCTSYANEWRSEYLLGMVYLESGDGEKAVQSLEEAVQKYGSVPEVVSALEQAQKLPAVNSVPVFRGHTDRVSSVCLSKEGRWALFANRDKTLHLWDICNDQNVRVFEGHTLAVNSICLSLDDHRALSGSDDMTLRLWDVFTGRCLCIFKGHEDIVNSVCLSPDGRWALSGSDDKTLRFWDTSTGQCVRIFEELSEVKYVCLSANGRWALSVNSCNTQRLWEINTGCCVYMFEGHMSNVNSVYLNENGSWVLSDGGFFKGHTLQILDTTTGRCLRVFKGHTSDINSVCLSTDGRWVLSGSSDKTLRLWETGTGRCVRIFEPHKDKVCFVCLSANGRWAIFGTTNNILHLWYLA
ncbi:MAG TPA: serine/threonine-protein kinase [Candidatus Hydrogenedentes bacterium]|nr:serine/threonine-protein kinase [Candidatus Hydrogenedentota bacterium]